MVAQSAPRRLLSRELCRTAVAHGQGFDLRGLNVISPTCQDRGTVRAMAEGLRVFHQEANRWAVPSASHPGEIHTLYIYGVAGSRQLRVVCNCEAGKSGRYCKHAALVEREFARRDAEQRTVAQPSAHEPRPIRSLEDLYTTA